MRRILLVDDHPVVLDGLSTLLTGMPGVEIVAMATDRPSALTAARVHRPDLVVLDLRMQGSYAPETVRQLKAAAPGTLVLLHTATEEMEPVRAALRAGADAVAFKDGSHLVAAVRSLLAGEQPEVDPRLRPDANPPTDILSPREYDVLCAYADGRSTTEVAERLFLAEGTVRSYTKALLAKLGAHSRVEAVAIARSRGLL
ncbi:response regulator transcription factor [Pseudonocardia sp.]|uniref:response regulator transcription factor n=1 Tax=Pseudonocardia sp. TaxID=60912 RepID=UPI003D0DA8B6